jgi:CDP-diacylglycerol--glycerol-3-phosphate 3-phosphatidyltransferase
MEQSIEKGKRRTFTDQLRVIFRWFLVPMAGFLKNLGIHPNTLTIFGLLGTGVGAFFLSQGDIVLGGFIILLMGIVDALDGPLARLRGTEEFGAFVDSVSDRYSELFIFGGLMWYYVQKADTVGSMLVFAAAAGSILVSYIRARAQSLGFEAKVGILTRVERVLIIGPSLLFNIPIIGVGIIAFGANVTALQRIFHMRQEAQSRNNQTSGEKE